MLYKVTGAGHSVCGVWGGVRGSAFNGAWGKREEGGYGRELSFMTA